MLHQRRAGVLLHPSSLPGQVLGESARAFVDLLAAGGFSVWQTLPLNPPDEAGSPYASSSVFAGNPALLDAEQENPSPDPAFVQAQSGWLPDYALFTALHAEFNTAWYDWPAALRDRDPEALHQARLRHAQRIDTVIAQQAAFDQAWNALRAYAHTQGVLLFGDLPFFVAHDSADVWAHPQLFQLRADGHLSAGTGVPPDYFSKTGQQWNMPHYHWPHMAAQGYAWWIERMRRQAERFDLLRIDHFRGLEAAWSFPADAATAIDGHWETGPGMALLHAIHQALGPLPLVAEDLGFITPAVDSLRSAAGYPGMRVLQFAFDGDPANLHLPENCPSNTALYSGTHDNDTLVGWLESLPAAARETVQAYAGKASTPLHEALIERVLASPAALAVLPLQDLLGLNSQARMNIPGTESDNWHWRLEALPEQTVFTVWQSRNQAAGRICQHLNL